MRRLLRRLSLYAFHICIARPVLKWVVAVRYRRRNLVPRGPCLVVANHNSHLDAAVLLSLFPLRRLAHAHPVAAADYFGENWLRRTMAMLFMNAVAIARRPASGADALAPVAELLRSGESLVFFPEGSRGEAGVVAAFRPGIGYLVRNVPGVLVVPVFLSGPERIWPRGNVVPVPLSVDVHVGRPRSYPPDLDARTIAEQVRRDVLALAPPPPPVPGPRPSPPLSVAVCGLDADRRAQVFRQLALRLGRSARTVGVGDTILEADGEGLREAPGPVSVGAPRAWLSLLAGVFRTGGRYKGERFVEMVERARLDEALNLARDTRFVVADGSALVDLLAWAEADFYRGTFDESGLNRLIQVLAGQKRIPVRSWWRFITRAPEVWLINVLALARPQVPDVLVLLEADVPRLMQRLRSRGEALEPYQNERFLASLQDAYRHVGGVLERRSKVQRIQVEESVDPDAAAERVALACQRLVERASSGL